MCWSETLAPSAVAYALHNCLVNSRATVPICEFEFYHVSHKVATCLVLYPCKLCHLFLCNTFETSMSSGGSPISSSPQLSFIDHEVFHPVSGPPLVSGALAMVQLQQRIQDGQEHQFSSKSRSEFVMLSRSCDLKHVVQQASVRIPIFANCPLVSITCHFR
jgi:hypothetical protein